MASSPLVSMRIPVETLERLDRVAQALYPPRRSGKGPNRSQAILDAIEQFLDQQEAKPASVPLLEEEMAQILKEYKKQLEQQIQEYIDEKFLAYAYNLEQRLHLKPKVFNPAQSRKSG